MLMMPKQICGRFHRCKQQLQQAAPETQALVANELLLLVALHYPHLRPQARPVLLELLAELVSLQAQVCSRASAARPWLPVVWPATRFS